MSGRALRSLMFGGCLCAVSAAVFYRSESGGQPPRGEAPAEDRVLGASHCVQCHSQPNEFYRREGRTDFIRFGESVSWQEDDLHRKAFEALTSPLGQQMSKLLGYDVTKRPECLSCHAVDKAPEKAPSGKTADHYYTEYGVSCESCHGFATQWGGEHFVKTWRGKEPAEKESKGMWDMRNPARRAERCASCHIGDAAAGRFVTHTMYAAGHPPLPAIETMAFSRDEPMHYKFAKDLPELVKMAQADPESTWRRFHFRSNESQAARQVAVGAIACLRSSLKLLAEAAKEAETKKDGLDLAHFDCYACHHDLQSQGWRQQRGFNGVPGRPQLRPAYMLLASAVARNAAESRGASANVLGQFDTKWNNLVTALAGRPFGDPAQIASASNDLIAWCDAAIKELDQVRYDPAQTARLIKSLAQTAAMRDSPMDADAAQQFVWAIDVLCGELADDATKREIGEQLASIKEMLPTQVREPRGADLLGPKLDERLERLNRKFDPEQLKKAMTRIAGSVKAN